ncbi:MAG: xanthine dehydrogenase family protein molybdopterin-binding subunit [Desulfobacterota bacterium]|nr:xanthine dehydrogenase family protein molybdopterin-binding subunit [Thermodesulfobacteriota bacterium]
MAKVIKVEREFEGHRFEEYAVFEREELRPWGSESDLKIVSKQQRRIDGRKRVTGRAIYTADMKLPRMLYGKILRSPLPHAKIKKIETRKAESLPGVRLVLTFKNAPKIPFYDGQSFLFDRTLRYAGDEIACVIAEEEEICEEALGLIEVDYLPLPFVLDPEEALKPGAPKIHPNGNLFRGEPEIYERGDVEKGLKEASIVVEDVFRTQTALHNSLETHGSLALWEGDRLTVWDSTQHIFGVREALSELLQLPLHKVRVIQNHMGGGFGSKTRLGKYTLLAAIASRMTDRPVRILLDRHEENLSTGNRPSSLQYLRIGAKEDGTLTAIDLKVISAGGAYIVWPPAVGGPVRQLYACPNVRTVQYTVFTNTGPMSAFRAPGYVEGTFALESLMDELAKRLGIDPLDLRLKNYADHDQVTGRPYSSKNLREAYRIGAERIGWQRRERTMEGPKRKGFGMASQIWGGSGGPPAHALIKINPDGTATVIAGTQEIGTGTLTALAQIAAEELGFPIENISVEIGDTQTGPYAPVSAGSMSLASVGPAVRQAAHDARNQILDLFSQLLNIPPESLTIQNSRIHSPFLKEPIQVKDLLSPLGDYMIIGRGSRSPNPQDVNVNTFGAQFAEVEVDIEMGEVEVKKIVAVHDSGRIVNPLTCSSQIEGGVLQGIGFALTENRIVDRVTGSVLTGDLENYKIPTLSDCPELVVEMIDSPDARANNLASKGVGEPPIIPTAAAIGNAVADALGCRIKELPITRGKVLSIIQKGRR